MVWINPSSLWHWQETSSLRGDPFAFLVPYEVLDMIKTSIELTVLGRQNDRIEEWSFFFSSIVSDKNLTYFKTLLLGLACFHAVKLDITVVMKHFKQQSILGTIDCALRDPSIILHSCMVRCSPVLRLHNGAWRAALLQSSTCMQNEPQQGPNLGCGPHSALKRLWVWRSAQESRKNTVITFAIVWPVLSN